MPCCQVCVFVFTAFLVVAERTAGECYLGHAHISPHREAKNLRVCRVDLVIIGSGCVTFAVRCGFAARESPCGCGAPQTGFNISISSSEFSTHSHFKAGLCCHES